MANFYADQHIELYRLIDLARNDQGATLLIPDLQRPYIWKPQQVVLLIDSLIRGWPFGTFLTWQVKANDPVRELARSFWKVIDRVDATKNEKVSGKNPPGNFQMVLDGQQRIQSLLMAVAGDAWGIRLSNRDWREALADEKKKTRQDTRYWSLGCLCVDLNSLLIGYEEKKRIVALDFTEILKWVVTGGLKAQSETKKQGYQPPLPNTADAENADNYIRLSRFWDAAPLSEGIEQYQADELAQKLLKENGISESKIAKLMCPVASFLINIARVKMTRVTFLELSEFDEKMFSRDAYNDAVVNIFTRLNTAGRTLTREDITFAWLKTGWVPSKTNNKNASECFSALENDLKDKSLTILTEDLVAGVSFVWATAHSKGRLLTNNDLLKGELIRPMAVQLSENWTTISKAITDATSFVEERDFRFNQHYFSLYSLFVLWAWYYIFSKWLASHNLTVVDKHNLETVIKRLIAENIDRWLLCSQWSGKWAANSVLNISSYASALSECSIEISGINDPDKVILVLRNFFKLKIEECIQDALATVQNLRVARREYVRQYYVALWLWHRLDGERWRKSSFQLKFTRDKKEKTSLDVDHTIAYALWEKKVEKGLPKDITEKDAAIQIINRIGNCTLLEKCFNISKSDRTMKSFLEEVIDFKENPQMMPAWASALQIADSMLDPTNENIDTLVQEIDKRENGIVRDISEFIAGTRPRVDLNVVAPVDDVIKINGKELP